MPVKARFHFACEATADPKTNVIKVKSIELLEQDEVFIFPPELQQLSHHAELCDLATIKSGLKSLTKRGHFRNLKITLTEDIAKLYLDTDENVRFKDHYLEEFQNTAPVSKVVTQSPSMSPVVQMIEKKKNLSSLVKDMVLDKFTGKRQNAVTWLTLFESECIRLEIATDKYSEVLRLFLEGSASEWFSLNLKIINLTDSWEIWKNSFLDSFGDRGWADVTFAYNYKYVSGTLNEYAIKKLNLLLEVDPAMVISTQINLVAIGLPAFVRNRLHRREINTQSKLIIELNQLESLVKSQTSKFTQINLKQSTDTKRNTNNTQEKKPCERCEKAGYPGRMHPEVFCRYNPNNKKNDRNLQHNNIKIANNTELEKDLNTETNQKN